MKNRIQQRRLSKLSMRKELSRRSAMISDEYKKLKAERDFYIDEVRKAKERMRHRFVEVMTGTGI